MADLAPNAETGALKRRSTRIVQAVPLTVTGVDALGRPFEERTSTSIINCHGCRYQSKHYVLKNMWVTLEVPHPEQGRPPRSVRARVMWIQRPRTVRELFQVGVELEVSGNLWGIAFCPPDWFPFPDSESEIQAPPPEASAFHEVALPETAEEWYGVPEPAHAEDNLRTMPMAAAPIEGGNEPSVALARQMEQLLNEAKQQLREAVRDHAAAAVSMEAQPLVASLQNQLQEAAEKSVQVAAATAAEQAIRNAVGNAEATAEARLRELIDRWNEELSRSLEQYHQKLEARSGEIGAERREAFEQQFQSQVEQRLNELASAARNTVGNAEATAEARLRELVDRWNEELSRSLEQYHQKLEARSGEIGAERREAFEQQFQSQVEQRLNELASAARNTVGNAKATAEARLRELIDRWNEELSRSLKQYYQKLEARSGEIGAQRHEAFEQQFQSQVEQRLNELATAAADSQSTLERARENLEALRRQAEDSISVALRDGALRLQAQADDARTRVSEIENVLRHSIEQIAPLSTLAQADWKAQLEADAAAAAKRWDDRVESSIESATQKVTERLAGTAQAASERFDKEQGERIAGISKTFTETAADAEARLAAARASLEEQAGPVQALLTQVQSAARPITEQTAQLDALIETARQELERRAAALIENQSQELARRAENSTANWTERLQPSVDTARQEFERLAAALTESQSQELARRGETAMAAWTQRLQPFLDAAQQELERRTAALAESQSQELARRADSAMATWAERLQPSLDAAQQELERRAAALAESQSQELTRRAESAMAAWTQRLQPSLDAAQQELERRAAALAESQSQELTRRAESAMAAWTQRLQPSLDAAQQELERRAAALAESQSQELARRTESAMAVWAERLQPSLDAARQELERLAAALTESQSQELARRGEMAMAAWTQRLQPSLDTAQQELERRAAVLIKIQSQELARRGESAMAAWTERLQPSLESAAQETVARLGAQFEQHLGSHIDRANQMLGRLESESLAAGEGLRKREESLVAASNRIVEAATVQLQRQIETLQHDFQEAGRHAVVQWLAEIDSKATETTHTTFESLFKTAEWYEKKVQAHMQTALEKGLEQGVDQLRDKAGEISRLFAGELDHYSRSYVEHAHEQIEEASHEAVESTRKQSNEMTSASFSALSQQMQSATDAAMGDFQAKTGAALGKLAAQTDEHAAQTRAKIETAAQRLSIDFGASITQQAQQALRSAELGLTLQANSARDSLRAESDAREKHLREALAAASDQGIETYKQRLESAANSWLLTTVSKLNQDSQQQLGTLTRAAETRLRDTCKQVFANVGEALRQQMLDLPLSPPEKDSSDEKT